MKKLLPFIGTRIAIPGCLAILLWASGLEGLGAAALSAASQPEVPGRISVKGLELSRAPTTEELMAAGQLGGWLCPTHELKDKAKSDAANLAFGRAIDQWNQHEYTNGVAMFRKYLVEYSDSPWAAEAALHIGCDAIYNGRYTEAEAIFNQLIQDQQGKDQFGPKMMLNKARQRLALLKVEQNNLPEAEAIFSTLLQDSPDWRHRTYASHWIQRLSRYAAAKQALLNCGAEALAYALEKEGHKAAAASVRTNLPSTMKGHSLASLSQIAADNGLEMAALNVTAAQLGQLPLPAILHVNAQNLSDKGHYWVLDKIQAGQVQIFDPQSGHRFHQTIEELAREWNGNVLAFSKSGALPGRKLDLREMEDSSGGCCGAPRNEDGLGDPGANGDGPGQCSEGAPRWAVNLITMNLYVTDTPMWHTPPIGPPVRISLSYNSQSAIAHNEPFGSKWQFSYGSYLVVDTAGTVTLFMPDGRRDVFAPDGAGGYSRPYRVYNTLTRLGANYFELRFPDDTVYVYQIPPGTSSQQPFLVEIRDAHAQKLSFGYDSSVRLTTITNAQAQVTRLSYNGSGLVTSVADPFGRTALFHYDSERNLTNITDMGGYGSSLSYDNHVNLSSLGDARGVYAFQIEPANGINNGSDRYPPPGAGMWEDYRITVTDPSGHPAEYYYNGYSGYSWHVTPRDYVPYASQNENNFKKAPKTLYYFGRTGSGRQGEIRTIERPEGDYTRLDHDPAGNVTGMGDAHGDWWHYTYNDMGRVTSVTDPKGTHTDFAYATNNWNLVSVSDGRGQVRLTYNAQHDLRSITDWLNNRTSFGYNSFGQIIARTNAAGIREDYAYNADHLLTQVLRAGQPIHTLTYDATNRVRTHTDATGLTRVYDYNNLNQVTRITYPDGKSESYVYSSCCARLLESRTDRGGRTVSYLYDALKRRTQTVNPERGIIQFAYDANGNRTSLTDPNGNITSFAYDLDNRIIRKTYADGKGISFGYDQAGLLVTRTNGRGITTAYTYDANHNLLTTTYSDGTPAVTNSYDALNRLTQAIDGAGTNIYAYDANSRVANLDGPWPGDTIAYGYDGLGRRTNLTVAGSQPTGYDYDALNRLTRVHVGGQTFGYSYAGASPLVQRLDRPNGSFTSYQYDGINRETGISNRRSTGEVINEFLYSYNAQDFRASETVSNGLSLTLTNQQVTCDYNRLNQLLTSALPTQVFAYDDDGNLTAGFTPDGKPFSAVYDAENRLGLISISSNNLVVWNAKYDYSANNFLAQERRWRPSQSTNQIRYIRDGYLPIQERDGVNAITRNYAWGLSRGGGIEGLLSLTQGSRSYSYAFDGRGNVAVVLDESQALAAAYAYDAFGIILSTSGSLDQPYRFSTKPYDANTGLSYFGYRWYAPTLSRWLSRDPIQEAAGLNLYTYVGNDPMDRFDPYGLCPPGWHLRWKGSIDWQAADAAQSLAQGGYQGGFVGAVFGAGAWLTAYLGVGLGGGLIVGAVNLIAIEAVGVLATAIGFYSAGAYVGGVLGNINIDAECLPDPTPPPCQSTIGPLSDFGI